MSSSCVPLTDVSSKGCEEVNAALAVSDIVEKWVHVTDVMAEVGPMDPIAQADLLGLSHDPVGTRSPHSSEKTSEVSLVSGRSIIHELSCCL